MLMFIKLCTLVHKIMPNIKAKTIPFIPSDFTTSSKRFPTPATLFLFSHSSRTLFKNWMIAVVGSTFTFKKCKLIDVKKNWPSLKVGRYDMTCLCTVHFFLEIFTKMEKYWSFSRIFQIFIFVVLDFLVKVFFCSTNFNLFSSDPVLNLSCCVVTLPDRQILF